MSHNPFLPLVQNAALLLAIAFLFDVAINRWRLDGTSVRKAPVGLAIGTIGLAVMAMPWTFGEGIVFDTRSVLLGLSGLFFGWAPTAVAMAMTAAFRLSQGGAGAWTGVAVIVASGAAGIAWRHFRRRPLSDLSWTELYLFGLAVHLAMLLLMLTLPWARAPQVLASIAAPVMLIYPAGTSLLGILMVNRIRHLRLDQALRESEALLARSQEIAHVGCWILDHASHRLTWSDEVFRIFGLKPQEFDATYEAFLERVHPDDRSLVDDAYSRSLSALLPSYSVEHRIIRKDTGEIRQVHEKCRHERNAAGEPLRSIGMVQDVTERKGAEEALRENEQRFRLLVESSPHGIYVQTGGRFTYLNKTAMALFGADKPEDMLGMPVLDRFRADFRERIQERIGLLNEKKMLVTQIEEYLLRMDGQEVPCEVSAVPIHYEGKDGGLVFLHDITQRKRAEQRLAESHQLLHDLARLVPGVIYQYRLYPDGRSAFPYASPGMNDIYEVTPAEVRQDASPVFGHLHPEDHDRVAEAIFESARTLETFHCEFRVVLPSQGLRWRWSQAQPQRMEDGGTLWHGIILDVTDRKQAEEEQERLQSQLSQAQKMESVGRLAGGVAHDFNNMLGVILGHAEMALAGLDASHPLLRDLQEIEKAALRSAELTRRLLGFARRQTIAPRALNLNDTIESILRMLHRLLGEDIDLAWLPQANLWHTKLDPSQLDQILTNLCVNARDAIAGVGRITIETANVTFDDPYCAAHAEYLPGDYVMFAVSDDGCGMSGEVIGSIFDPFFTTKEVGKGTGLGLSTVYGIVKQNSGFINVYSEPEEGSTFKVYLPRLREDARIDAPPAEAMPITGGAETILLVEDEPMLLKMGTLMLKRCGYTVFPSGSPEEALKLAAAHPGKIDLLITDVIMPGMNGHDLAKSLQRLYPALKVMFMSGYTANVIAHHGVLDEGVHFLQKPFTSKDLAAKVREALSD